MAALGRPIWAFDSNPDAVALARGLLTGTIQQVSIPTHRSGARRVKVPFKAIPSEINFCIAEPTQPPFPPDSFAWVHISGSILDDASESVADILVACTELLQPGGVLTLWTAHAYGQTIEEGSSPPEGEFLEAMEAIGLKILDQRDRVPLVRREFDRSFSIRFVHCVVARK
jgi:hypothetical protein